MGTETWRNGNRKACFLWKIYTAITRINIFSIRYPPIPYINKSFIIYLSLFHYESVYIAPFIKFLNSNEKKIGIVPVSSNITDGYDRYRRERDLRLVLVQNCLAHARDILPV